MFFSCRSTRSVQKKSLICNSKGVKESASLMSFSCRSTRFVQKMSLICNSKGIKESPSLMSFSCRSTRFVQKMSLSKRKTRSSKRLPPGSLGLPFLGQSLEFLRAMRSNDGRKWLEQRIRKYGPVSKLNLFGKPAVFIHGQAANKLVFTSDSSGTAQTTAMRAILGDQTLFGLSGHDHKRVRNALMTFLKPESLKAYVGKMDDKVNEHLQVYWQGKREITIFWVSSMTQMDEHIFPEPSKFDPGRFENQASIPPYSFIPFGGGPHLCAGYEFAKIETLVTIHYIVTQFTWKLTADDSFTLDPMPTPTRGLPIQIFPRNIM
ncbi:cytochrome P450 716B1-like protein [Tripterygium wilfordii]|uniref:Cytochrome P450 716B1-like protein n=1 Tax=Tripterygium wilfordii TaxID=458696 RepID=A0A7J7C8V5_TRIWF|nr:cytochrome P450 716B1-like protein [Tripterygium wilfordii]